MLLVDVLPPSNHLTCILPLFHARLALASRRMLSRKDETSTLCVDHSLSPDRVYATHDPVLFYSHMTKNPHTL